MPHLPVAGWSIEGYWDSVTSRARYRVVHPSRFPGWAARGDQLGKAFPSLTRVTFSEYGEMYDRFKWGEVDDTTAGPSQYSGV